MLLKTFKSIGLFLLVLFITDQVIGRAIQYLYFTEQQGDTSNTTYALNKAEEDIIVLGSSRASHHYDTKLIEDQTGLTCFNAGRDGMSLAYQKVLFRALLARHKPKLIILDVTLIDLGYRADEARDIVISNYLPYVNQNKIIEEEIYNLDKSKVILSKAFRTFPFNSLLVSTIQHHLKVGQKNYKGYEAGFGTKLSDEAFNEHYKKNIKIDYKENAMLVDTFKTICLIAKEENVKILVLISPYYGDPYLPLNSRTNLEKIATEYGHTFADYSSILNRREFFYDFAHLDKPGAEEFSQRIIPLIKSQLN